MLKEIIGRVLTKLQGYDNLLTVNQVAERIGEDRRMVYYYIQQGKLASIRKYDKLLVRESDLNEFLKK